MRTLLHFFIFLFVGIYSLSVLPQTISSDLSTIKTNFFSKERWGISYLNYINGPTMAEFKGDSSINHYLSLKHKFNSDWALSAVLRPDSSFGSETSSWTMGDSYLRLDYPTIYQNGDGLKLKGDLRYFAPLSESSKQAKLNGIVAPYVQLEMKTGRFDISYILIPKLFLNSVREEGQRLYSHGHWLAAAYKFSSTINIDLAMYPTWTYADGKPVAFNDLPIYPGFTINFNENLSLATYIEVPLLKAQPKNSMLGGSVSYTFL